MSDSPAAVAPLPAPPAPATLVTLREALVVFGATVGVSLLATVLGDADRAATLAFTNQHLLGVLAHELLAILLLVPWLRARGWTPWQAVDAPAPRDLISGVGVWLLGIACYWTSWIVFALAQPALAAGLRVDAPFTGAPAAALLVAVASVVNPVFEEFLWLAYGVGRLAPRIGVRTAAVLSVALRVSVHAYQGPWAILAILPLGVAFTWYFVRSGRLWPVIVAHALFDALGLAQRLAAGS